MKGNDGLSSSKMPTRPGSQPHNLIGTRRQNETRLRDGLTHEPIPRQLTREELAELTATIQAYRAPILEALGLSQGQR
jgi:hypothetical protein